MTVAANARDKKQKPEPPDVIYENGAIYVGTDNSHLFSDPAGLEKARRQLVHTLRLEALAIRGDRLLDVGRNSEILKLKGPHTQVIDLHGAFVMPGFNDAHAHLSGGGLDLVRTVDLVGTKSVLEMQQRIAAFVGQVPDGLWLVGRGWDHTKWADQKLPTRSDIDKVCGQHPCIFTRVDGHIAVINTLALQTVAIDSHYVTTHPGQVDVDASGQPTGIVREESRDYVLTKIPPPTLDQRRQGIEKALALVAQNGITSVQDSISNEADPTEWQNFLVYEALEKEGKLTARVTADLNFVEPLQTLDLHRAHHPHDDSMLHTGMLGEAYLDGSLGSRTAALFQPYSDDPQNSGILYFDLPKLISLTDERAAAGFNIGFHAIGDRAAQQAIDAFADAERILRERNPDRLTDVRFRIEHAQVTTPEQIKQMGELHLVASIQPCQLLTDMNWAEARLGPDRAKTSYAWRSMLNNGVVLAFGTDWPVEPWDPFRGLYAAVTRKNEAGDKSYYPHQKLTIDEAIAAYTTGSAYAEYAEKNKGLLAPGYLADFIVLDRDITKVPPEQILGTKVLRTVVGGKTVYEAK